ncbi:HIT family protein [Actinopolymorpha sp. B17G11]|uniref:HIT family protein n=1 Tax=Actinopolymorpha sp. B17G11 TaxID=3160861 RepID=UPI0032E49E69
MRNLIVKPWNDTHGAVFSGPQMFSIFLRGYSMTKSDRTEARIWLRTVGLRESVRSGLMDGCAFCAIADGAPAHRVLDEPELLAFLDVRPVFKGHVLLIPRDHVDTLLDLPDALRDPFFRAVQRLAAAMENGLGSQGSFVAVNNRVSQSVPHLHAHVIPRTRGDGLRGFLWPRRKYADDAEAADYAARVRAAL